MNITEKEIITLIKSAITNKQYEIAQEFKLEDNLLIKRNGLYGLVYFGAINCGFNRHCEAMINLFNNYRKTLIINELQMKEVNAIYQAFEDNEIDYMPVKGCNMKYLYPTPELRMMGDADILIKEEQYSKIEIIMNNLGFVFMSKGDHDYAWHKQELHVELHYKLIKSYDNNYESYYGNPWSLAYTNQGHHYYMSDEDEFIYLFMHFTKHYRLAGIGIRHVTDLWLYLLKHPNLNNEYIKNKLKYLSVYDFYLNTLALIDYWFNDQEATTTTNIMSDYILNSGSWGTINHALSSQIIKTKQTTNANKLVKLRFLLDKIFLDKEILKFKYPILDKHKYLLPIVWFIRWMDVLCNRPINIIRTFKLTNPLNNEVDIQEKMLSYVGLDFKFNENGQK